MDQERETLDYFEFFYLLVVFAIALPLNILSLKNILLYIRCCQNRDTHVSSFTQLRLHLNIADLCVLVLHLLIKIASMVVREVDNYIGCRAPKFLSLFGLTLVSNFMALIAVDRATHSIKIRKLRLHQHVAGITRTCSVVAYVAAFVSSCPQLVVYRSIRTLPFPNIDQCLSVFTWWHRESYTHNRTAPWQLQLEPYYNAYQSLIVFWLPMLLALCCYTIVCFRLKWAKPNTATQTRKLAVLSETSENDHQLSLTDEHPSLSSAILEESNPTVDEIVKSKYRKISNSEAMKMRETFAKRKKQHSWTAVILQRSTTVDSTFRHNFQGQKRKTVSKKRPQSMAAHDRPSNSRSSGFQKAVAIRALSRPNNLRQAETRLPNSKHRTLKKAMLIFMIYALFWLPYYLLRLYRNLAPSSFQILDTVEKYLFCLLVTTTVANPLIYGVRR